MAKGSVFKDVATDGSVRWRVRIDMVDPVTGKRRQPQRTYRTRREAEAGLAEWLVEVERGTAVVHSRMTVGEYMAYWLDTSARHRVRATTLESYEQKTRLYIVPALGGVPLQKLTPAQLQALYGGLLQRERPVSPRTVRYVHAIVHRALKEALNLGLVARNVSDAVSPPRDRRPPIKAWDVPDVQRFLDIAHDDGYWPLWLIAVHTGMRRGELLGLRWSDVDLSKGLLHVRRSLIQTSAGVGFQEPKTATSRRAIALNAVCVTALREHKVRQNERRLRLGAGWPDNDLVFASAVGTPIDGTTAYHRFLLLAEKAGCPRIPFHGLRHTHATILMKSGINPKVASERLGHSTIALTLQTYSHVLPQMQQEAADIFAAVLGSGR
jgi:integrase